MRRLRGRVVGAGQLVGLGARGGERRRERLGVGELGRDALGALDGARVGGGVRRLGCAQGLARVVTSLERRRRGRARRLDLVLGRRLAGQLRRHGVLGRAADRAGPPVDQRAGEVPGLCLAPRLLEGRDTVSGGDPGRVGPFRVPPAGLERPGGPVASLSRARERFGAVGVALQAPLLGRGVLALAGARDLGLEGRLGRRELRRRRRGRLVGAGGGLARRGQVRCRLGALARDVGYLGRSAGGLELGAP